MKPSLIIDQSWVREWQEGEPNPEQTRHLMDWIHTIPLDRRMLLSRFPPMCLVRANRPLEVPYPGTLAFVSSYEQDGRIGLRQDPSAPAVFVDPAYLTVAGYWRGFSNLCVMQMLATAAAQPSA